MKNKIKIGSKNTGVVMVISEQVLSQNRYLTLFVIYSQKFRNRYLIT